MSPRSKSCQQHPKIVTNSQWPTSRCHQHHCHPDECKIKQLNEFDDSWKNMTKLCMHIFIRVWFRMRSGWVMELLRSIRRSTEKSRTTPSEALDRTVQDFSGLEDLRMDGPSQFFWGNVLIWFWMMIFSLSDYSICNDPTLMIWILEVFW